MKWQATLEPLESEVVSPYQTDDDRWHALLARDENAIGVFLYGVITTGVVCHPGCGSRQPNRENVKFFETLEAALEAGFRPC
ncbi:MAG: bifunctional transcriptional activator/DNA repair enzyme protein Ada, partial [Gammaproteobacteria bacterium]|nr:bifunctional transcriptional activator/DNA repair enzyme protein Ada [Gammaproteobacteria bacterium]